jgi:hypothetical protein
MKFRKMPDSGWAFIVNDAEYFAVRNEAGFAHRNWELYRDGHLVADQLASRAECVDTATSRQVLARALLQLVQS